MWKKWNAITQNKWVLLGAGLFQTITTSVVLYGWPNLESVLIEDGEFGEECYSRNEDLGCDAQVERLSVVFTIASTLSFCFNFVNGLLLDQIGVKRVTIFGASIFALGYILVAMTSAGVIDALAVGYAIAGAASVSLLHPLYSISNLFPNNKNLVLAMLNGFADSSAVIYFIFRLIYFNSDISLHAIIAGYLIGPVFIVLMFAFFVWPKWPLKSPEERKLEELQIEDVTNSSPTKSVENNQSIIAIDKGINEYGTDDGQTEATMGVSTIATNAGILSAIHELEEEEVETTTHAVSATDASPVSSSDKRSLSLHDSNEQPPKHRSRLQSGTSNSQEKSNQKSIQHAASVESRTSRLSHRSSSVLPMSGHSAEEIDETKAIAMKIRFPLVGASFRTQLLSVQFIGACLFAWINMLKFNFFFVSINSQLQSMGDDDGLYTQLFGGISMAGALVVFFTGYVIDKKGVSAGFWCCNIAGILVSIFSLIPVLEVQILTFIVFVVFRSFLFSIVASFLAAEFGYVHFGKLIGITFATGGAIGVAAQPMLTMSLDHDKNFAIANGILLGLSILQSSFPLWYSIRNHKLHVLAQNACEEYLQKISSSVEENDKQSAPESIPARKSLKSLSSHLAHVSTRFFGTRR